MNQLPILIMGDAGFVGSRIAERFIARGWTAQVLDNLDSQVYGATRGSDLVGALCSTILHEELLRDRPVLQFQGDDLQLLFPEPIRLAT